MGGISSIAELRGLFYWKELRVSKIACNWLIFRSDLASKKF